MKEGFLLDLIVAFGSYLLLVAIRFVVMLVMRLMQNKRSKKKPGDSKDGLDIYMTDPDTWYDSTNDASQSAKNDASRSANTHHAVIRRSSEGGLSLILCMFGLFAVTSFLFSLNPDNRPPLWGYALYFAIVVGPAIALCCYSIPGVYDITIDEDDILVRRLFISHRWKVSRIRKCEASAGTLKVYMKGRKKPAFAVDITLENYSLFGDRMHEEGIPMKVRKSGKKI